MSTYINREDIFDSSNIITVYTKEYGTIEVIPMECLIDLPISNVKEIKYGHWEYDPNGTDWNLDAWRCSECRCKNDNLGMRSDINPYLFAGSHYCPHCGAKMRDNTTNKIEVRDKVIVNGISGEVININEFREPDKKYAIDIGTDDLIFVGDMEIRKCQNCQHGDDNSGYCLDCYYSDKWSKK